MFKERNYNWNHLKYKLDVIWYFVNGLYCLGFTYAKAKVQSREKYIIGLYLLERKNIQYTDER